MIKMLSFMFLLSGGSVVADSTSLDLHPVADAYANSVTYNTAYGTNTEILVRNWSNPGLNSMKGYMRFEVPWYIGNVTSASLSLVRVADQSASLTYRVYGLKYNAPGKHWEENGGATWNNAPANNTTSGSEFTVDATGILRSALFSAGFSGDALHFPDNGSASPGFVDFLNTSVFFASHYITLMLAQVEDTGALNRFATRENSTYESALLELECEPILGMLLTTNVLSTLSFQEAYSTGDIDLPDTIKYVNGSISALADFTGDNFVLGEYQNGDDTYLLLINKNTANATASFTGNPINLDVYQYNSESGSQTLLTGMGGYYTLSVAGGQGVLLRFTETSLTSAIGMDAKLASRRTVALKTAVAPYLYSDPSTWNAMPVPMDFIAYETAWGGSNDLDATGYVLWDSSYLYVGAVVLDDEDISGDQVVFSIADERVSGYYTATDYPVTARQTINGKKCYASAIPWSSLNLSSPTEGTWYAFSIAARDSDSDGNNVALWASGTEWFRESALLGMIFFAGESDAENAIEKCTETLLLKWDKKAIGLNETLDILITGGWPIESYAEGISLQVLDENEAVVGTPAITSTFPWQATWTPTGLTDGNYTVVASLDILERTKVVTRDIEIQDAAKAEAQSHIDQATTGYNQSLSQMSDQVAALAEQSLDNAELFFSLGRFDIADDSARQVIAWSNLKKYKASVPALDSVTVDLDPIADAHANSAAPESSYGTGSELWVRSWSGTSGINSMKTYLRFEIPSDVAAITSAELILTRTSSVFVPLTNVLYGLEYYSPGQDWVEHSGATWNNAPANDTNSISGFTWQATDALSTSVWNSGSAGSAVSLTNTLAFIDFLNTFDAGDVVTLMISQDQDTGSMNKLASRENTTYDAPTLRLVYNSTVVASLGAELGSVPTIHNGVSVWSAADYWYASNSQICVGIKKSDLGMTMSLTSSGEAWQTTNSAADLMFLSVGGVKNFRMADAVDKVAFSAVSTNRGCAGFEVQAGSFPALPTGSDNLVRFEVMLYPNTNEFIVTLFPSGENAQSKLVNATYPHSVFLGSEDGNYAAVPHESGFLVPMDWSDPINTYFGASDDQVTPTWLALVKQNSSLTFFPETSYDMYLEFTYVPGDGATGGFSWHDSWEELRYPRRVRYVLQDSGDYVSAAKRFRQYQVDAGNFRSLDSKIAENTNVLSKIGSPVVLTGLYDTLKRTYQGKFPVVSWSNRTTVAQTLRARGLTNACVHHVQWNSIYAAGDGVILHPSLGTFFPPNEAAGSWGGLAGFSQDMAGQGWQLCLYSNFRDACPLSNSWSESLAKKQSNGLSVRRRNPVTATSFYSPRRLAEMGFVSDFYSTLTTNNIGVSQMYLDVFGAIGLREDFDARRPLTRERTAYYQKACMDQVRAQGLVVICERPTDWAMQNMDGAWDVPLSYLGGVPVPLFPLVYHDALIAPYAIGETDYDNWLRCLLYGRIPRIGFFPGDDLLDWVKILSLVHSQTARSEMIKHTFVSTDGSIQESEFSNGIKIRVNFSNLTYKITGMSGFSEAEQALP